MNTGPAERITNVRKKLAAAVGIKPKSAITIIVLVEGIGGSPSTISAMLKQNSTKSQNLPVCVS
jgi:mannose/fructose-specific phosphotransferase system component IIA